MFGSLHTFSSAIRLLPASRAGVTSPTNLVMGLLTNGMTTTYRPGWIAMSNDGTYVGITFYGTVNTRAGIWISSNGGSTFTNTSTTADNLNALVMSQSAQYMYANCMNVGRIYRSTNYGASFSTVAVGSNISSIATTTTGQNVYVLDFSAGTVLVSTDYGATFTTLLTIASGANLVNLRMIPEVNTFFFTSSSNGNVYRYNIGTSTLTNTRPNASATDCSSITASTDGNYLVATYNAVSTNQVWYSTNGGTTWTGQTITPTDGSAANGFGVVWNSPNGQNVYLANGGKTLYVSTNCGASFFPISWAGLFSSGGLAILPSYTRHRLFLFSGSTGYVTSAPDQALTTTLEAVRTRQHWYMQCSYDGTYVVATITGTPGGSVGIWTSSNRGASFTNTYSSSDSFAYCAMSEDASKMYVVAQGGRVYRSSNFGASWTSVTVTGSSNLNSVTCNSDGSLVFAIDYTSGVIYASSDSGATYASYITTGVAAMFQIWYAEATDRLYCYSNGGTGNFYYYNRSTKALVKSKKPNSARNDLWMDYSFDGVYMFAVYGGTTTNQFWRSVDSGETWTSQTLGGGVSGIDQVMCSPTGQYVYARRGGTTVYLSTDYGVNFTEWSTLTGYGVIMNQAKTYLMGINGSTFRLSS